MDSLIALIQPGTKAEELQKTIGQAGKAMRDRWTADAPHLSWADNGTALLGYTNRVAADTAAVWADEQNLVVVYGHAQVQNQANLAFCLPHRPDLAVLARYLVRHYALEGPAVFARLSGSFLVVMYQVGTRQLVVATDRLASRSMFYCQSRRSLAAATDIRGLLALPGMDKQLDPPSVVEFLRFGMVLEDRTLHQAIHCVAPASVMIAAPGDFAIQSYWQMKFVADDGSGDLDYASALAGAFRQALTGFAGNSSGTAVMLSGGLDSRVICAAAAANQATLNTVSFGEFENDDVRLAQRVAASLQWDHHFIKRKPDYYRATLPEAAQVGGGMYAHHHAHALGLHEQIHELGIGTVLEGWGLDLLFSGTYLPHRMLRVPPGKGIELLQLAPFKPDSDAVADYLLAKLGLPMDEVCEQLPGPTLRALWQDWPRLAIAKTLEEQAERCRDPYDRCDMFHVERFAKFRSYLFPLSMRAGVRQRNPMYDNGILDLFLRLPASFRFNGRAYRQALAVLSPKLSRIPYSRTGIAPTHPVLMDNLMLIAQPTIKTARLALRRWRGAHREYPAARFDSYPHSATLASMLLADNEVRRVLLSGRYLDAGLVGGTVVRELVTRHQAQKADYGQVLLGLLTLAMWLEQWC